MLSIAKLESAKRDNIPASTVEVWWEVLKDWDEEKFNKQIDQILKTNTYGAVKIDDFLQDNEATYSDQEVNQRVTAQINKLTKQGEYLLSRVDTDNITLEDYRKLEPAAKLHIAYKLKFEYQNEQRGKLDEIVNDALEIIREKLNSQITVNGGANDTKIFTGAGG